MREKHTLAFPIFLQAILLWFLPFSFLAVTLFLGGANKDKIKKAIFPGSLFLLPNFLNIKCKLRSMSRKIAYQPT
jgi:hypothetical protein